METACTLDGDLDILERYASLQDLVLIYNRTLSGTTDFPLSRTDMPRVLEFLLSSGYRSDDFGYLSTADDCSSNW